MRMRWIPSLLLLGFAGGARAQSFSHDFEDGYQGWIGDFADYPAADNAGYKLQQAHEAMPGVAPAQNGIKLSGNNMSDDLFLFLERKVTGLVPNASYTVIFSIDLVTNMPPDGIGGGDLMLKAGATLIQPQKVVVGSMYRMNIDKANQTQPGPDMDTLGHVNHKQAGSSAYHLVTFTNASHPFKLKTDSKGEAWLIVGAESAYEVPAELLVAKIEAVFTGPAGIAASAPAPAARAPGNSGVTADGRRIDSGRGRKSPVFFPQKNRYSRPSA
jgi:hypothetical protein